MAQIFEEEKRQALTQAAQSYEEEKRQVLTQAKNTYEEEKRQALTQAKNTYEEEKRRDIQKIVTKMIEKGYDTEEITSLIASYSQNDVESLRDKMTEKSI